ncbi:class 1 fructose-bisphosphatase [Helicobacter vulpis]|uniref:class 1 fructose-bisphosphatase n=1 Tax=Helicobacter vulpis TaxID=2316076 RepID=UPI000EB0164A|nr:class 1 fructose-bisphosphatase [Helicobacter vulpis]
MDTATQHVFLEALQHIATQVYQNIKSGDVHYTAHLNPTADMQLELDVQVDRLIFEYCLELENVGGVMSEEQEKARYTECQQGYLIAFDPLDGSSVVGANFLVGSIFGIYAHNPKGFEDADIAKSIEMGAYILYGAKLELVVATRARVAHYLYNEIQKAWTSQEDLSLKPQGKNIAPGGSWQHFSPKYRAFLDHFFNQGYRLRYSGSMVADAHHLLHKQGGLFCYPATQDAPKGKLRKLFEVYPMAFVVECAGGLALDGQGQRLLDTPLESLHDKSACFLGSQVEMQALKEQYANR